MQAEFNTEKFNAQIQAFAEKTESRSTRLVAAVTEAAFKEIRARTPVETGKARASWRRRLVGKRSGRIWSSLPYIRKLELGSSKQAGRGFMIRKVRDSLNRLIREALPNLG